VKENECKEKICLVCFQREEYWCRMGCRRGTGTRRCTPPHLTTTFIQRHKAWPRPSVPTSTSAAWWVATTAPLTEGGAVLCIPLCPHLINAQRVQTVFLEEEDHQHEGRVASSKMGFRELSGGIEDEGYKGWKEEGFSIKKRISISHFLARN